MAQVIAKNGAHSFHIPVMGIGFTLDTPLKVSKYGIDSVMSLVDDILMERLREMYCGKFNFPYTAITEKIEDYRAKRITSYLNLMNELAKKKFEEFTNATAEKTAEIKEYFSLMPDTSTLKKKFIELTKSKFDIKEVGTWLKDNLSMGSLDVNIMTKLDKDNFKAGEQLPVMYNDAHAALRGFANSDLESSIVLSAGMNPRLYSYLENFEDFFPNENGELKKKIILKVSDYRSAFIQGRFLAKKGIWISEYRIESGLNCGGHAFATEGYLMGPILAEFKEKREELTAAIHKIYAKTLESKNRLVPKEVLELKITAQGGVGTAEEHEFLMDHYELDSVGWCSPFLLVPEVVNVDETTLKHLADAKEEDLEVSTISPLGVHFNNLKKNTKDISKFQFVKDGKPGSVCPKRYLVSTKEFTEKSICTSSRQYQKLKIKQLEEENLPKEEFDKRFDTIVEKSCICVGLGTPALLVNGLDTKREAGDGVSVCPGPNIAYFSKKMSFKDMVSHIYGKSNMISRTDRPNVFIKELEIYVGFFKKKVEEAKSSMTEKQEKYIVNFSKNLNEGIDYYHKLVTNFKDTFADSKSKIFSDLEDNKNAIKNLNSEIGND